MIGELATVTANRAGAVRREKLEGREHLVVPVTMLTEGVHAGSQGPMYYPEEELSFAVESWNGRPVTLGHPKGFDGANVSANTPAAIEKYKVGTVHNAAYDGTRKRLTAEAWIDVDRLRRVDPALLANIAAGKVGEVSTGLFSQAANSPGDWNGQTYNAYVLGIRPDHLAILTEGKGAWSVACGCGLNVNEEHREHREETAMNEDFDAYDLHDAPSPLPLPSTMPAGFVAPAFGYWSEAGPARQAEPIANEGWTPEPLPLPTTL